MKNSQLLSILNSAKKIYEKEPVVPILENLLIQDGQIIISNLMITYCQNVPFKGSFLIPFKELLNITKSLNKNDSITLQQGKTKFDSEVLIGGHKCYSFKTDSFEDFPNFYNPTSNNGNITTVDIENIKTMQPFLSHDELRPALNNININGKIAATDGHKLSWFKTNGKIDDEFLLHRTVLPLLKDTNYEVLTGSKKYKDDESGEDIDTKYIALSSINDTIIYRETDEQFPDFNTVIPTSEKTKIIIDKQKLLKKIQLATITANPDTHLVKLSIAKDVLTISSEDLDRDSFYTDSMKISYFEGFKAIKKFDIGFSGVFLMELLKNNSNNYPQFAFNKSTEALIIDNKQLLMPLQLSDNYDEVK